MVGFLPLPAKRCLVTKTDIPKAEPEQSKIEIDPYYYKLLATAGVIALMIWGPYIYFSSRLDDLLHTPGIKGGRAFWTVVEDKLYKLADEPDLPPEHKEKIVKALQKLSAKYHPYIDALVSEPPVPSKGPAK